MPIISIARCSKNPQRWYVSFPNVSEPFHMPTIRQLLEKRQYQVLANTPNVNVFRNKEVRLTWHSHGLIQVDLYNHELQSVKNIEHLIKEILVSNTE
jgi:hypothetical protein